MLTLILNLIQEIQGFQHLCRPNAIGGTAFLDDR